MLIEQQFSKCNDINKIQISKIRLCKDKRCLVESRNSKEYKFEEFDLRITNKIK